MATIEQQERAAKQTIEEMRSERASIEAQIAELRGEIDSVYEEIDELQAEQGKCDQAIRAAEAVLEKAAQLRARQLELPLPPPQGL